MHRSIAEYTLIKGELGLDTKLPRIADSSSTLSGVSGLEKSMRIMKLSYNSCNIKMFQF